MPIPTMTAKNTTSIAILIPIRFVTPFIYVGFNLTHKSVKVNALLHKINKVHGVKKGTCDSRRFPLSYSVFSSCSLSDLTPSFSSSASAASSSFTFRIRQALSAWRVMNA